MRRLIPAVLAVGLLAGCQPQTDPDLKAALVKIASTPTAAQQPAADVSATLQPRLDSIRESLREVRDAIAGSERKFTSELAAVVTRLDAAEKRASAAEVEATAAKVAAEQARAEASRLDAGLASLKTAIDEFAGKVKAADPERYLELMREIAQKERELSTAQLERDNAKKLAETAAAELATMRGEIDALKSEIEQLSGASIARHPDYVALQSKNRDLDRELKAAKQEADRLKGLVDSMVAGGATAAQPGAVPGDPAGGQPADPASPWAAGFGAEITSVTFSQETQKHSVLAKLVEGDPPRVGDILTIVDSTNKKVCEFQVMRLWDDGAFGGSRVDRGPTPAPTVGDKVVRARSTEAQGR